MLEAKLRRIATRGAVTLFNAVRKQQKDEDVPNMSSGKSEGRDVQAMDKKDFLGMLSKKAKTDGTPSNKVAAAAAAVAKAAASDDEGAVGKEQGWSVLKEDYMLGSKVRAFSFFLFAARPLCVFFFGWCSGGRNVRVLALTAGTSVDVCIPLGGTGVPTG